MKYLRWFCRVVRPHAFSLAAMMFCHVALAVCSIVFVYACKRLVDAAVSTFSGSTTPETIKIWFIVLSAIVLLRIALNACRSYIQTRTEIKIKNGLRRRLFDILLRAQSDGNNRHHTGDILNRIQEDVRVVSTAFASSFPNLFGTALQLAAAMAFLIYLDLRLAIVIVVVLPVGMLVGRLVTGRVRKLTLDIRKSDSKVQSHLQESIQHLTLLQSLEYADTSSEALDGLQGALYGNELRRMRFSVLSRIFVSIAFQAGYVTAFMWGVLGISHGTVTYGMMTAFLQLVGQIQRPLLDMSSQIPSILHATASIDRILDIEGLPQEDVDEPILLEGTAGVSLDNVSFAYPSGNTDVLHGFSYEFTPGSRTAIVGPTGVGKSTMIRLLLSLLKPQSGSISIYDEGSRIPVSAATRCNLVYVPQGNTLFSGTIRDNLLMGNPEASEEQLKSALYTAAADFVMDLPDGLDTQCFESGGGLSEGQAQRVSIARALLRPGSVLLLDEFSSALDAETEVLLMDRLTAELSKHTMIFITHRPKIIEYCTDVVRLT